MGLPETHRKDRLNMMQTLSISRDGDVAVLTLARPPANALDVAFLETIADAIATFDAQADWRALVVCGSATLFSAGADLKQLPGLDLAGQDRFVHALNRVYTRLYGLSRPTVAAIGGHAIAGGLVLALCCDYRIATTGPCRMGLTEVKVGVAFPVSALEIARAELTPPVFRRFALFGGLIDAPRALADGVVDELADPAQVMPRAMAKARELCDLPRQGFAAVKAQMRAATLARLHAALDDGHEPQLGGWVTDEARTAAGRVLAGEA
jgi:enoyl-CoA hydratase